MIFLTKPYNLQKILISFELKIISGETSFNNTFDRGTNAGMMHERRACNKPASDSNNKKWSREIVLRFCMEDFRRTANGQSSTLTSIISFSRNMSYWWGNENFTHTHTEPFTSDPAGRGVHAHSRSHPGHTHCQWWQPVCQFCRCAGPRPVWPLGHFLSSVRNQTQTNKADHHFPES